MHFDQISIMRRQKNALKQQDRAFTLGVKLIKQGSVSSATYWFKTYGRYDAILAHLLNLSMRIGA